MVVPEEERQRLTIIPPELAQLTKEILVDRELQEVTFQLL
jgi:hypothetical protein